MNSRTWRGKKIQTFLFLLLSFASLYAEANAQRGGRGTAANGNTVFGDFKVEESRISNDATQTYHVILYNNANVVIQRQAISNGGRFRFLDVPNGDYYIVVEVDGTEAARIHLRLDEPVKTDVRQDINMEWHGSYAAKNSNRVATVSVDDIYKRTPVNQKRFDKAGEALDKKNYSQAITQLRELLDADPQDFQAWTELGTAYLLENQKSEAEKAYRQAIDVRPSFLLALINLGRLYLIQKNYDGAIEILSKAVKIQPQSANANFYLGEAYLQNKKGSMAVGYLNEAIRLDPIGKADAHLRLALLYNAVGLKAKAALEYEQFLAVRPDYPDRKKLEQYISENKQP